MPREGVGARKRPAIRIELPSDRLQVLRFIQALSESDYLVCIAPEYLTKLEYLKQYFDARFSESRGDEQLITDFEIIHETPLTRIGSIERPLIFPRAYFSYLRELWDLGRDIDFSFIGLMTPARIDSLNAWLKRQGVLNGIPRPPFLKEYLIMREKIKRWLRVHSSGVTQFIFQTKFGSVMIGASDKGRVFPGKAWDDDYFRMLARSRFVLCPAGDFVWTYRFFESIMCGAIPIVEASCSSYNGFRYFTMDDPLADIRWSSEIAEHNFNACLELLTISREALNEEISQILSMGSREDVPLVR
jgi:hypothetical protein